MIILDADSLMTGETIVRLASAMERHPDVALIQTLPIVVNARTLFGRLQQFSGRLYGPLIAAGIAWWHGSEGNYWGHNAIIRVRAFARDAGLPDLKGRKPFGGHILSHDFVEAALMRRGGWAIRMAPALGGSFEECPPSLLDFAARDRRWCQGNLQHLAVLPARGLHWVSRLHLLTGIGSYLTAPLWLLFLVLGILISLQAQFVRPEYFPKGFSLFPKWPAQDPVLAAWVFVGTMGLLILPKLLACILLAIAARTGRQFGGGLPVVAGLLVETFLSGLIAPVMMIFQSVAVGGDPARTRCRLAGSAPRRRRTSARGVDAQICAADAVRDRHGRDRLRGVAAAIALDGAGHHRPLALPADRHAVVDSCAIRSRDCFAPRSRPLPPQCWFGPMNWRRPHAALPRRRRCVQLRDDQNLLETHLINLPGDRRRHRGQIDPDLAIARAKIEEAENFDEALSYLTARETFAVLSSNALLRTVCALPRGGE